MARKSARAMLGAGWRAVRGAGPQRLVMTVLLLLAAVGLARFSWGLPFTDNAERSLYDYRVYSLAELVPPDDRILQVVYTDQSLIDLKKRSPLDRGLLAAALRNLDTMGAKAIGLDMLFDQPQDEDDELVATLRAMKTPVLIGYIDTETAGLDIGYAQQEFLDSFMQRLEGSNARPASVRLEQVDGVSRLWPEIVAGQPPVLGRAMLREGGDEARTFPGYEGAVRFRRPFYVDQPVITTLQIDLFANPDLAPAFAPFVAGRYVLVGGDIIDYDRALTPFSGQYDMAVEKLGRSPRPPGIEVHSTMVAQMLDGARLKQVSPAYLWGLALLIVLAAGMTALLELKSWRVLPMMALQLVLVIGLPFGLAMQGVDTYGLPAVGPALAWVLAFSAVTSAVRASTAVERQFAQGALGKYLPREMADQIIEHPELLKLHGEKKEIFVLFSDLEGFTKMSHAITPEMVAMLLNRYLEMLSQVVLDHGGVIDKFVGDAVVAFWGAPIAHADDGMRAAKAGYAVWQAGEAFREWVASEYPDLPRVGKTRVGLHFGEAVVGNFGGDTRIQYTALGDSMNTAARLESANKALKTSVMASDELASRSGLDWWRPMGSVVLSGRAQPVALQEPAPDFPESERAALVEAVGLLLADQALALAKLAELVERNPHDSGLAALLERSRELNEAGAHVLGSK